MRIYDKAALPNDLELTGPTGDAVAVHLSEPPDSSHRWRVQLLVQSDEGMVQLGECITVPPVLGSPPNRIVAIGYCPGVLRWKARILYAGSVLDPATPMDPDEIPLPTEAYATLSSRDCCASTAPGFHALDILGQDRHEIIAAPGAGADFVFQGCWTHPLTTSVSVLWRGNQRRKRAILRNLGTDPAQTVRFGPATTPLPPGPGVNVPGTNVILPPGQAIEITEQRDIRMVCDFAAPVATVVTAYEELFE